MASALISYYRAKYYAYTGNNPVNGNDPTGQQVYVTQNPTNPNSINIDFRNVYFTGNGNSASFQQRYITTTESGLSGTFPPYTITTRVNPTPNNAPVFGGIDINVVKAGNLGQDVNGNTILGNGGQSNPFATDSLLSATFPANASKNTILHEDFHLIAPDASYLGHNQPGSDIMNAEAGVPRKVTAQDFTQAFTARGIAGLHNEIDLSGFTGPIDSIDQPGAAGGFLLYPNKPNTSQLQSVYLK